MDNTTVPPIEVATTSDIPIAGGSPIVAFIARGRNKISLASSMADAAIAIENIVGATNNRPAIDEAPYYGRQCRCSWPGCC